MASVTRAEGSPGRGGQARRRADAQRSIDAIVEAALRQLGRGAEVNLAEIARAAGVGRVTLYAHFPSKEALVEAAIAEAIARGGRVLDEANLDTGTPLEALGQLTGSAWQLLDEHRHLTAAGQRYLGPARLRALHDPVMGRVEGLIGRAQREGTLPADTPRSWLLATFYALLHAAAEEVNAGRLGSADAGSLLASTVIAALRAGRGRRRDGHA